MIGEYLQQEPELEAIEDLGAQDQRDHPLPAPAFVTLHIQGGRKEKVRPGDILGALTGDAGIDGKRVGKITVTDNASYVAIEQAAADNALNRLRDGKIKGRKFKVRRL